MQEVWVQSLGWKNPLEEEMATHSSILAWEIPWTEESGGLQCMWLQESDMTEHARTCLLLLISDLSFWDTCKIALKMLAKEWSLDAESKGRERNLGSDILNWVGEAKKSHRETCLFAKTEFLLFKS